MRKFFAVAMGSLVALAGFAGVASASSTVDLVWIDVSTTSTSGAVICLRAAKRNCGVIGTVVGLTGTEVSDSDSITLGVIITAGPLGTSGGGVSVDYSSVASELSVGPFQSLTTTQPLFFLPQTLGSTTDTGVFIDNINASAALALSTGIGLPAGGTAYLGTVTFHKDTHVNGTFEITVGENGPGGTDGLLDILGYSIVPVYNSAWLINVPEPGALSLLVMGVGGMLLAGRGRRS